MTKNKVKNVRECCSHFHEGFHECTLCLEGIDDAIYKVCYESKPEWVRGMKTCKFCGNEFVGGPTKEFCNQRCYREYHAQHSESWKKSHTKICANCGKPYIAKTSKSRYCDEKSCVRARNKEWTNQYKATHKEWWKEQQRKAMKRYYDKKRALKNKGENNENKNK